MAIRKDRKGEDGRNGREKEGRKKTIREGGRGTKEGKREEREKGGRMW